MKPATIRRFDWCYLAWVVLTIVDFIIQRGAYVAQVQSAATGDGAISGGAFVTGLAIVWTLFMLLLWFLVSRRRSMIARWIIVVLAVIGFYGAPSLFRDVFGSAELVAVLMLVASVLSVWSLFGPGAKAWFAGAASANAAPEG